MSVKSVIDRCTEIYEDVQLQYVRQWKEKTGGMAVGYLPIWIPKEIFYAANVLPVGLMGNGDIDAIHGDACYQSYICHMPRSIVEMGASKMLDPLVGIICPSVCDTVRNMIGVWNTLFPEKFTHYLDLPQNFKPEIGGEWFIHDVKNALNKLVLLGAKEPTVQELNNAIKLYNENRRLLRKLDLMRSGDPARIPTHEFYLLVRAGNTLDVKEHNQLLVEYMEDVKSLDRKGEDNIRVAVVGGFCEQPPLGLVKTVERAGCYVVWDDYVLGNRFIEEDIDDSSDDPYKAICDAFLFHSTFSSSKYSVPKPKPAQLIELIRARKVDGVILAAPSFCDPILLDVPEYVNALKKEKIHYIQFQFSEDSVQYRAIEEEVGAFSDSIRVWK